MNGCDVGFSLLIVAKRLVLRRFCFEDISDLIELISDTSVAAEVGEFQANEASVRTYIDRQNAIEPFGENQVMDLAIERTVDGKVIGLFTVIQKQFEKVEIGYALCSPYRGQGYATEAARAVIDYCFGEQHSHRVQAIASSGNPKSWRVMERLGMKQEGRLREANLRDGRWCDLLYYGILVDEWEHGNGG